MNGAMNGSKDTSINGRQAKSQSAFWRRLFWRVLALALLAGSLVFLNRTMGEGGWRLVGGRIANADPRYLAGMVGANLAVYLVWGARWRALLRPVARAPWWPAQRALMISILFNTVVPFARSLGGLVRAGSLARALGIPTSRVYGPTLIDQTAYSAVSLSLGALSVPFAMWGGGSRPGRAAIAIIAGLAIVALLALFAGRGREALLARVRARAPGTADAVAEAVGAAGTVLKRPSTWPLLALGGAAVWLLNVLTFYLAGHATGTPFGFGAAAAAWSFGSIAGVASGTPGGVGTTETAAIMPLVAAGLPAPDALAAVLMARLVQYGVPILIGAACMLRAGRIAPVGDSPATPDPSAADESGAT